ncbi:MAG TPA: guanylate kinase [Terriglobales bacterium]|nr:guanylate kinase [Terriglobales bacterium]
MTDLFIISAPSGSGKSTLVNELRKSVPNLDFSISYTTRPPRGSERDGHEYFFVTREKFEDMVRRDQFLEHAEVFGHYYGTARRFLEQAQASGHDLLLDIDVQGAAQVKQKFPDAVSIFVLPPSRAELERRLRKRSQAEHVADNGVIERRLRTATKEIENYSKYDYILVNDRLEQSTDLLEAIVLSERLQRSGKPLTPEQQSMVETARRLLLPNAQPQIRAILASFRPQEP